MKDPLLRLSVCFFGQRMFYAIGRNGEAGHAVRIGSQGFSFPLAEAFRSRDVKKLDGVYTAVKNLRDEFEVGELSVLTFPAHEAWTTLPKLVQDKADEREAYLSILMHGMSRQSIETTWSELSNRDFRFLTLRDRRIMSSFVRFAEMVPSAEFVSDYEVAGLWHARPEAGSSYLTIGCHPGCITVASHLLGKLRGATFFRFDVYDDIPYFWLQSAKNVKWMQGLHEQILIYGVQTQVVKELLHPVLDPAAQMLVMDSLQVMGVKAEEETYNFDLSQAFPAIANAVYS